MSSGLSDWKQIWCSEDEGSYRYFNPLGSLFEVYYCGKINLKCTVWRAQQIEVSYEPAGLSFIPIWQKARSGSCKLSPHGMCIQSLLSVYSVLNPLTYCVTVSTAHSLTDILSQAVNLHLSAVIACAHPPPASAQAPKALGPAVVLPYLVFCDWNHTAFVDNYLAALV